ncbi:MAG: DUF2284 domain-containing protein [Oscillospiraceae bacterium]|nr:DUF2284 domain-containing protein [Oscillospiraceae bacterium]
MADSLKETALALGFDAAADIDVATLKPQEWVRSECAENKCQAFNKNWTCPPACGTLEECGARMQRYRRGMIVQTIGQLQKDIDSRGYAEIGLRHSENFRKLAEEVKKQYPDALCLGAGGCRVCKQCAYPEPCRFPEKAYSSMEGYGLFVTQVCRDNGVQYNYGRRTIAYSGCVLYDQKDEAEE